MAVNRQFLGWDKPALVSAADYVISRFAQGDELDLSKVIVVVPGRRAGRRFLELVVQRAESRWPGLQPPRIVTFNAFPEMLYPQQQQLADELTQLLVWRKALYTVNAKEISAALPHRPDADSVNSWLALCESLRRQHNELAADGLEFDEVHQQLAQSGDLEESERWKALRRIQAEYLVQMDELKLWDTQAARLIAVQQNEIRTDCDIVLVGTTDMNRTIRQMLAQIPDRVTALIHAPQTEAEAFDEFGCVIPEHWENRLINISFEATRITGTPLEQARVAMNELASYRGQFRADDITVGVADDKMVPTLMQAMADAGIQGHWPVGRLLRETRPWRLLSALATHIASARDELPPDFATLADLVRHPDVFQWITETLASTLTDDDAFAQRETWLEELDRYMEEHLQMTPGAMLGKAPRRLIVAEVCRSVETLLRCLVPDAESAELAVSAVGRIHKDGMLGARQRTLDDLASDMEASLTSQLERKRPLVQWAEGAVRVLATIYHDRELKTDSLADRGIVACVTGMQDLCEQLRTIPSSVMPECSASQALQLLLRQLSDEILPPEWDPNGIELLGWLDLPLDDAPVLVLTGFNEGNVPESITSDAFMPNSLRSRLNLTDNRRRYARDACALTAILNSRRRVVFIKGRFDVQGNPLTPSRLWFAAETSSLPDRVRWFYSEEGDKAAGRIEHREPETVESDERSTESGFVIPSPSPVPPPPEEIVVTAFRDYLQCPYRYFLRRELRLSSVDDDVRELSASAFGNLIHDVLRKFGESPVRDSRNVEAIETWIMQELHRLALARFGRSRSATISVQLKMAESRLGAFAKWQVENFREGWRIFYTEQDLTCDDFRDIHGRPVRLRGRVDRIDRHQRSGKWRVLDYKTSETAEGPDTTHRKKDEWVDLQLPLYRLLVRSLKIEKKVELGYINLPGDLTKAGVEIAEWSDSQLEQAEQLARQLAADIYDLRIDNVSPMADRFREFSRLCQDTVIDRQVPWLPTWRGRQGSESAVANVDQREG